jgi:hypothetical protein
MVIEITGIVGHTRTEPERAVVSLGETVRWVVRAGGNGVKSIEWQVYFNHGSPFKERSLKMTTEEGSENGEAPHAGVIDAGEAQQPGEYKYGVRAVDTSTNQELSDDDPFLIVQSR